MTRLGQITMTGALMALVLTLVLTASMQTGRGSSESRPTTGASSYLIPEPDPGFWRTRAGERTGMTRLTVLPNSGLELTNLGASGAVVLESGALILTDAEGVVEMRRAASNVATELAPLGIGSKLGRGDRLAFGSSATIAFRNQEPGMTASMLVVTELPGIPLRQGDKS